MKSLKYLVAITVAVILVGSGSLPVQAEGLRHLVWQNAGTNYIALGMLDATNNVAMINGTTPGHVRAFAILCNTNSTAVNKAVLVKIGGLFATNGTADVTIPAGATHTFNFGEGYNGPISVRSAGTVTGTTPFLYWEGGY